MHETIWIEGREHRLIPRTSEHEPERGWARALIDDPCQQHLVHLLAGRYLEHVPGRDHREVIAELELELDLRFIAVTVLEDAA